MSFRKQPCTLSGCGIPSPLPAVSRATASPAQLRAKLGDPIRGLVSVLAAACVLVGCKVNIDQPTVTTTPSTTTSGAASATTATTGTSTTSTAGASTSSTGGSSNTPTTPRKSTGPTKSNATKATESTPSTQSTPSTSATDESKNPAYNPARLYQLFSLKTAPVTINGQRLTAWIADNDSLREEGLMFVKDKDMRPDQAMLFVFPDPREQSFWMHNTYIPLDIAYIGQDKNVVSATTMATTLSDKSYPSGGKAMYVLEMREGTLRRLGIGRGTHVDIPDSVKASQ